MKKNTMNRNNMYRNGEGYYDPTAGAALSRVMKDYKKEQKQKYRDKNRRRVYVASKFAGDVEKNTKAAAQFCRLAVKMGYMPMASHLMYPGILREEVPQERELGMLFGLAMLKLCDEVWVCGEISEGVRQEIMEAKRLRKQIRYFDSDMKELQKQKQQSQKMQKRKEVRS